MSQPSHADDTHQPIVVAVLPFQTDMKEPNVGAMVAEIVSARIDAEGLAQAVDRENMNRVLQEQGFAATGVTDNSRLSGIGHLLGADLLVTGRVTTVSKKQFATCKAISVQTSQMKGFFLSLPEDAPLDELLDAVHAKLLEDWPGWLEQLMADRPEVVIVGPDYHAMLEGKRTPTVAVVIVERHEQINRPVVHVIDPAAETGFKTELLRAGIRPVEVTPAMQDRFLQQFVAEQAPQPAQEGTRFAALRDTLDLATLAELFQGVDYLVFGEGLSSQAHELHGLQIAAARVEGRIIDLHTGRSVVIDAVDASAPDLTIERAGKTALQKAGLLLAQKTLPPLFNTLPQAEAQP